jgi:hypothetical protein
MSPEPVMNEKLRAYVQALESANEQLVIALKKCLELLSQTNPPGDSNEWARLLGELEEIVRSASLEGQKPISNLQ